jgi:uncharacterized protein YaeQ
VLQIFHFGDEKLRLWQAPGESYEHVLMKALAYSLFSPAYAPLEIETRMGLRYKPDLVSIAADGTFDIWIECGLVSLAKTSWLMKHTSARRVVICKIGFNAEQLIEQLREAIAVKYRPPGRLTLVNFDSGIVSLTASRQIAKVSADWYTEIPV